MGPDLRAVVLNGVEKGAGLLPASFRTELLALSLSLGMNVAAKARVSTEVPTAPEQGSALVDRTNSQSPATTRPQTREEKELEITKALLKDIKPDTTSAANPGSPEATIKPLTRDQQELAIVQNLLKDVNADTATLDCLNLKREFRSILDAQKELKELGELKAKSTAATDVSAIDRQVERKVQSILASQKEIATVTAQLSPESKAAVLAGAKEELVTLAKDREALNDKESILKIKKDNKVISEFRYSLDSADLKIERTFLDTSVIINKSVQDTISAAMK